MDELKIVGAGSAFPNHVYRQQAIAAALTEFWRDRMERPELLGRLHANCGVEQRHLSMPIERYARMDTFGKTNTVWIETAEQLGSTAICRAITPHNIEPKDIDALFFTTVTGISSPSIDARLVNRMTLNPRIKRMPLFGLGCVAGAAGIARAADYLRAFPDQIATVLSVELCSLTWQRDDLSTANLISTGLFGDGAAAVVLAGSETGFDGPEIIATRRPFIRTPKTRWAGTFRREAFKSSCHRRSLTSSKIISQATTLMHSSQNTAFRAATSAHGSSIPGVRRFWMLSRMLSDLPENALEASWECIEARRKSVLRLGARCARRHTGTTPS